VAHDTTPLRSHLPADGLAPLWESETIPAAGNGGWSSPIVWDGKVYLFAHQRTALKKLGPQKYPFFFRETRPEVTKEQYEEYEKKRRAEDLERGKAFDFREVLYCLDSATGKSLWKNERPSVYTRFLQSGTPIVDHGKVYILGAGLNARAVDARTGRDLWQTRLPGEFVDDFMMSSFVVADGVAAVLAGHLRGLDAETGKILWEGDPQRTRGVHSSPVAWQSPDGPRLIANVAGHDTICVEPKTGREIWRVQSDANLSTPVILGERMLTLGNNRRGGLRCFQLSPQGAELAWKYQRLADKGSSPVVVGDYVYAQGERRLACVALADGREAWSATLDLESPQYTSLVAGDGKVIYAFGGVIMFAADPAAYRPLFEAKIDKRGLMAPEKLFRGRLKLDEIERGPGGQEKALKIYQREVGSQGPLPCSSPALVAGRLYLRLRDRLACYDFAAPDPVSSVSKSAAKSE
jgi:outer membrane protein assembly factor BamB